MNDLDTDARDPELAAGLERLAERGPHADPGASVERILAAAHAPPSIGRRLFAVAAGLAVLGGLGAAGWTAARSDDGTVIADEPTTSTTASDPLPTTAVTAPTSDPGAPDPTVPPELQEIAPPDPVALAEQLGVEAVVVQMGEGVIAIGHDGEYLPIVADWAYVVDRYVVPVRAGSTLGAIHSLDGEVVCEYPLASNESTSTRVDRIGTDDAGLWIEYEVTETRSDPDGPGATRRHRRDCATGEEEVTPSWTTFDGETEWSALVERGDLRLVLHGDAEGNATIETEDGLVLSGDDRAANEQVSEDGSLLVYANYGSPGPHVSNEIVVRDPASGVELLRRSFDPGFVSHLGLENGWIWVGVNGDASWVVSGGPTVVEALYRIDPFTGEETVFEVNEPILWLG